MRNKILIFIIICSSSQLYSQEYAFVWNLLGSKIYNSPSQHSSVLKKLEIGDSIKIAHYSNDNSPIDTRQKTISGFTQSDLWIPVELDTNIGFVFMGDFSTRKPKLMDHQTVKILDYENHLGPKLRDTSFQKKTIINKVSYNIECTTEFYEHGNYKFETFDGCFDHIHFFQNFSFNEIFHVAMSMYSFKVEDELITPIFFEEQEGEIRFWGTEATVEIIIRKTKNGWEIYSYDCT